MRDRTWLRSTHSRDNDRRRRVRHPPPWSAPTGENNHVPTPEAAETALAIVGVARPTAALGGGEARALGPSVRPSPSEHASSVDVGSPSCAVRDLGRLRDGQAFGGSLAGIAQHRRRTAPSRKAVLPKPHSHGDLRPSLRRRLLTDRSAGVVASDDLDVLGASVLASRGSEGPDLGRKPAHPRWGSARKGEGASPCS